MSIEVPLIWTKYGNKPVSELEFSEEWDDGVDVAISLEIKDGQLEPNVKKSGYVAHRLIYRDKETGEIVRRDSHVCAFGLLDSIGAEQGNLE